MPIEEIYLIHHTHVDVGYTDLQPVIYEKHVQFLEQVLDLCTQTDDYPDECKFRWVSEFAWPVMRFLKERPERAEEMMRRLREGRIELAALFLDPTDLMDRRAFEIAVKPALDLARDNGFMISTAMTSDVPGLGWSVADVLAEHGIPYLSVSPNAMVSKPILVERPFWWEGPGGNKVLTWQTDWRNGWYGEGHVLGFPQGIEVGGPKLREYLELLQSESYPWRALLLHMAADYYPPFPGLPDFVRQWNEQPDMPRMRISTNREFFERMRELHGDESFRTYRAAWPDWWSEGLGSAAYESALSRETHCRLQRIEALQSAVADQTDLWPIWEDLLLFDEHTWGCSNMGVEPHSFDARASWMYKATHAYRSHDAARRLEETLVKQAAEARQAETTEDFRDMTVRDHSGASRIALFNPLPREFEAPVELTGLSTAATALDGSIALQQSPATKLRPATAYAVVKLQPWEARTFTATAGGMVGLPAMSAVPNTAGRPTVPPGECLQLINSHFRLKFTDRGKLLSLWDLQAEQELLDTRAPWGFGETVHEIITSEEDRAAIWQRGYSFLPYAYRRTDANFERRGALEGAEIIAHEEGPLYQSLTWRSELPWVRYMETEIRLWHELPRVDVEVRLDKQARELYESLYIAFPFAFENPHGFIHCCDAAFEAEREQLPGTVRDYYGVQHFAAVSGDGGWAVMAPVEAPLAMLGQLSLGRWSDHLQMTRSCLYGWLTNNFWYTNFPAYQQGELRFRFSLTAGTGNLDLQAATEFGETVRVGVSAATL
jgi:hypothetical protein